MRNIAIFASGSGSNAENIYNYFIENEKITVKLFLTNNPTAFVIERAKKLGVPCFVFSKEQFILPIEIIQLLKSNAIDWIVLAGFLLKIPTALIEAFPNKIINIHPALLPNYGGKGMYGDNVHKSVVNNNEKESGITIHFVNANYDEGKIIFQAKCEVLPTDSYKDVASKIHQLEYNFFPKVIEDTVLLIENGK